MKNSTLNSFIEFCAKYPQLRFWQALTAWSGKDITVGGDDPFYWEALQGEGESIHQARCNGKPFTPQPVSTEGWLEKFRKMYNTDSIIREDKKEDYSKSLLFGTDYGGYYLDETKVEQFISKVVAQVREEEKARVREAILRMPNGEKIGDDIRDLLQELK